MSRINMEFTDEEFEAIDAIIRNRGGAQALKTALRLGLRLLVDEKTLEEKGKFFSEIYISNEHRERILAGESLVSIAGGLAPKSQPDKPKKDPVKKEMPSETNVENNVSALENVPTEKEPVAEEQSLPENTGYIPTKQEPYSFDSEEEELPF